MRGQMTEKLKCIRDKSDGRVYRVSESVAQGIMRATEDWCYTSKGAWKRDGRRYIPSN